MLDIEKDTAKRIIDALAVAIDGKPSSAKSFNQLPYEHLADYGNSHVVVMDRMLPRLKS